MPVRVIAVLVFALSWGPACGGGSTSPSDTSTEGGFSGGGGFNTESGERPRSGEDTEETGEGFTSGTGDETGNPNATTEGGAVETGDETGDETEEETGEDTGEDTGEEQGGEGSTRTSTGDPSCEPQCNGKSCGGDGCGGTCGSCDNGQSCLSGACVHDNPFCEPCPETGSLPATCSQGATCANDSDCPGSGAWSGLCTEGVCQYIQTPCTSAQSCKEACIQNQGETWPVICGNLSECIAYYTDLGLPDGAQYCQNVQAFACEPGVCGGAAVCTQFTPCSQNADCPTGPSHAGNCLQNRCTYEPITCAGHGECVTHCVNWATTIGLPDPEQYCTAEPGFGCLPSMCPPYTSQCTTFTPCSTDGDCLKAGAGIFDMACVGGACALQGWLECASGTECKAACEVAYGSDADTLCGTASEFLCK